MDHPFHSSCQVSTSAKLLAPCVRRLDEKGEKLNVNSKRRRRRLDGRGENLNVGKNGRRITSLSSFPDELLQEILCKLPVRVLTRFKCVSKLWGDLISSQQFISLHVKKCETSVILVNSISRSERVRGAHASISPVYPPSTPPNNAINITLPDGFPQMTSACNGIICLWDTDKPDHIALWNPANKDLKMIPQSKLPRQFTPKSTHCMVLFGYDDVRNDYKIMRVLIGDRGCGCLEYELYSLNSGLWKKLDFSGLIRNSDAFFARGMHSTGGKIVSWFMWHDKETRVEKTWEVVLFDMCSERYEIVQVPVEASLHYNNLELVPYDASIGVMDCNVRDQMWVLKDINSRPPSGGFRSWKKVDVSKFSRPHFTFIVVGFWDERMLFLDETKRLIMFDLGRSSYDDVGFCRYRWVESAFRYKESLVRLL